MNSALGFCLFETAIGECAIGWDSHTLVAVHLPADSPEHLRKRMATRLETQETPPPAFVQAAIERIRRLLQGEADDLMDLPLAMDAVPEFHRRVYEVTRAIPPGRTLTYGEVAQRIGDPGAARAVGQALGLNPFAPVVPCHRVLAAGGRSGGFSAEGGTATKLRMLEIERARFGSDPGLFD
ncbi:MAG TPA: MGMT family protein [Ramlibacter sp.]|uniref:methylated-DNA--[protein]-cysteine S-methyltransferase n=1 Tax=Ramlibacter sp. TaxID=1917967 RepID=UPI002C8C8790|nr:MGMT family protein [Ramlibacter sp.]HVZ43621.1 MGMT family protein [Ramlibacter sp.]